MIGVDLGEDVELEGLSRSGDVRQAVAKIGEAAVRPPSMTLWLRRSSVPHEGSRKSPSPAGSMLRRNRCSVAPACSGGLQLP